MSDKQDNSQQPQEGNASAGADQAGKTAQKKAAEGAAAKVTAAATQAGESTKAVEPAGTGKSATAGESAKKPAAGSELAQLAAQARMAPPGKTARPAKPSRISAAVAWLALLLVLALAGAAGWYYLETLKREAVLLDRLSYLESTAADVDTAVRSGEAARVSVESMQSRAAELESRAAGLESAISELQSRPQSEPVSAAVVAVDALSREDLAGISSEWEQQLADTVVRMQGADRRQSQQLEQLASALAERSREPEVNINRDAWLLAEVEYLLRLANQRMIIAGDTQAATALLSSADTILRELDDITLLAARRALAEDLAALRSVPRLDIEGMYLRLGALIGQADALVIFELPDTADGGDRVQPQTWQERLRYGWESALQKLASYIVVRRRETPMEAMMDPHWERMVRQNLRMLLEQSQVALLSGNQLLFRESLQRTQYWVGEFFVSDEAAARALSADLEEMTGQIIAAELPDISGSMIAFDTVVSRKLGRESGE